MTFDLSIGESGMSSGKAGTGTIAPVVSGGDALLLLEGIGTAVAGTMVATAWVAARTAELTIKTGKIIVDGAIALAYVNSAVNESIKEYKLNAKKLDELRIKTASSVYDELMSTCDHLTLQLRSIHSTDGDPTEIRSLIEEINSIRYDQKPDDISMLEGFNSTAYRKLERITKQKKLLDEIRVTRAKINTIDGKDITEMISNLKLAIEVMEIRSTRIDDSSIVNADATNRIKLYEELGELSSEINNALDKIASISDEYGLNPAAVSWFESCFDGINTYISGLYDVYLSNDDIEKGIERIKKSLNDYRTMIPKIEKEQKRIFELYKVYLVACDELNEKQTDINSVKSEKEILEQLNQLKLKAERAKYCEKVYSRLGNDPKKYIWYAWECELRALGYKVYKHEDVEDIMDEKLLFESFNGEQLPCYRWKENELAELYSIGDSCSLHVAVDDDGRVSMQTFSMTSGGEGIRTPKRYFDNLKTLYERLKENWLIVYDYTEVRSQEEIMTLSEWREHKDDDINGLPADSTSSIDIEPPKKLYME